MWDHGPEFTKSATFVGTALSGPTLVGMPLKLS
jgi:hypothetical protein